VTFFEKPSKPLPEGFPLPAFDSNGRSLAAGDLVRIGAMPAWLVHDLPHDEVARLRACENSVMQIHEIDPYGYVWFGNDGSWFSLRPCEVTLEHP
jgi:hypothetical protein